MDPRRFNKPEYKNQIRAIRNYKRQVTTKPESKTGLVLHYLGLGTLKRQIISVLILLGLVYLSYFAKFLDIKTVKINGADDTLTSEIEQNLTDYSHTYAGIFPHKNILFFSKSDFSKYLTDNNYKISKVVSIKEKLWNSVEITIEQRVPSYALQSNGNFYILNSDSTVGLQIPADQAAQYITVMDTAQEEVHPGDKFLNDPQNSFLSYINSNFHSKMGLEVASYEVPGKAADQLNVLAKNGFKILFTDTSDPAEALDKFYKIWVQFSPAQQGTLSYVDMRFNKNAYVCFKGTACANSN